MDTYMDTYRNISTQKRNNHIYKYQIVSHMTCYKCAHGTPYNLQCHRKSSIYKKIFKLVKKIHKSLEAGCIGLASSGEYTGHHWTALIPIPPTLWTWSVKGDTHVWR